MCHLLTGKERVPISNLQNDHPYHTEPFWGTLYSKIWPFWNILNWAVHSKLSMGPFLSSQKIPQNSFGQRPWAILNKAQPSEPCWTILNHNELKHQWYSEWQRSVIIMITFPHVAPATDLLSFIDRLLISPTPSTNICQLSKKEFVHFFLSSESFQTWPHSKWWSPSKEGEGQTIEVARRWYDKWLTNS